MEANLILANKMMSSMEIAELTSMRHADVMRSIRGMEPAWIKINGRNFALVEYKDAKGEMRPMYQLTRSECLYVATKFNDEARAKLVIRWEQLENERKEISRKDLAMMVIASEEEKERLQLANEDLMKEIEDQKPAVIFTNSVKSSQTNILIRDLAKLITQNGHEIGQQRLYEWMVKNKYLIRHQRFSKSKGKYDNYYTPTQLAAKKKLFWVEEKTISNPGEPVFTKFTCYVTGEGEVYFINVFKNKKIA